MPAQVIRPVLAVERQVRGSRVRDQLAKLAEVTDRVRDGDERASRLENARNLVEGTVEAPARAQVVLARVLLPDERGIVERHQPALSATKMETALRAANGSSTSGGRLATKGDIEMEARTYSSTSRRVANSIRPSTSSR